MKKREQIEEIEGYVKRLHSKTYRMKVFGIILMVVTVCNLLMVMTWLVGIFRQYSPENIYRMRCLLSTAFLLVTLVIAYLFDLSRREGETLFEIVSDELHGKTDSNYSSFTREQYERISLQAKYVLREFSKNSDIPIIPGKSGPAILCLVNLLLVFAYTYISRRMMLY